MSSTLLEKQPVVLITGCSEGGIGFALCEEFAVRGCIVYGTARKLESMEGFRHPNIRKLVLDVTKGDDVERTVQTILAETNKIDVIVNNAGASAIAPIAEATIEQVRDTFELNAFGALRVSNAVIPSMFKRREGVIVNIGSISGNITTPWNTLYSASKAALHSISEGLAMECKPFGVKVMLVAPGTVKSNIIKNQVANLTLLPTTMFKDYESKIRRWISWSDSNNMDTNEFAQKVVNSTLSASPPPYMTLGGSSTFFYFLQLLPRQYALNILYESMIHY
ncbi:hypothetical protein JVU11DRAFT_3642 [Chiua virens]|nr:hypothetical protein JVU11DRAFT_3642 [Chiua virens]